MKKKQKAQVVVDLLNKHFPDPAIPLRHTSTYTLLIAVLLSAQCTDARVNLVTPTLFAKAQTPAQMVALSIPEIEIIIRPCGLSNNKAKAIWHLSEQLINFHNAQVPSTLEALEALPGVGHKTASVIVSQAFGEPAFPVDTHIHRCAKRWGLSSGKDVKQTEKDLKALFSKEMWNTLHLQMIYFARAFCKARGHKVECCPICCALES